MSKTRKTAPWRVRAMTKPGFLVEYHDHIGRGCDLPAERVLTDGSIYGRRGAGCCWVASNAFWADHQNWCGCPHCSDTAGRRAKSRRRRQEGRTQSRRWRDAT